MSELKLYNTLTRKKEVFVPEDEKNVRMYVCGPTVYDFAHIGNARPVIVFDVLYRLLRHKYGENHVTYVRNITDVDDKINARALRDYPDLPLNEAIRNVTEKTATQFHADVKALGCLEPTHEPRATDYVLPRTDGKADMQSLIQSLLESEHAYVADGSRGREVLFDISKMDGKGKVPKYGVLSNRKLDEQQSGARVGVEAHKRNAGDFVLWKQSVSTEPGWEGNFIPNKGYEAEFVISDENRHAIGANSNNVIIHGRPGWHIECSAMSEAFLGKTFDIHGGGLDLIFPHHENEIAQSCCAHGTNKMASVWMHNGYVQVEGKKMSKSDGNFVTIHEILSHEIPIAEFSNVNENNESDRNTTAYKREWNGLSARLSMLQTHYREPIDWTTKRFDESSNELAQWYEIIRGNHIDLINSTQPPEAFVEALYSDLNISSAITMLRKAAKNGDVKFLGQGMKLLGLLNKNWLLNDDIIIERNSKISEEQDSLIQQRLSQLRNADSLEKSPEKFALFAEADRIRDELLEQGIQLKDGKDPDTGERVTTWEVKR